MEKKAIYGFLILITLVFVIPLICKRSRGEDIVEHRKCSIGRVYKQTGSLKANTHWHYIFFYNGKSYSEYRPVGINYDVKMVNIT